jgi:hypothetical protein
LLQRGLDVRLGWTQEMYAKAFQGRQPEGIKPEEWQLILASISRRLALTE